MFGARNTGSVFDGVDVLMSTNGVHRAPNNLKRCDMYPSPFTRCLNASDELNINNEMAKLVTAVNDVRSALVKRRQEYSSMQEKSSVILRNILESNISLSKHLAISKDTFNIV